MCILIIKKKGVNFPAYENIKESAKSNPDGFSMAWNTKDGKLKNFKTMDAKKFLSRYKELSETLDKDETSMLIHCRISTHGSNAKKNCHCWIYDDIAFAHNGVLSNVGNIGDITDSETFFRYIFIPTYRKYGWVGGELAAKSVIGSSKFGFLSPDGEVHHYGNFIKDGEVLYSNSSYRPTPVYHSSYSGVGYGSYGARTCLYGRRGTEKEKLTKELKERLDNGEILDAYMVHDQYKDIYTSLFYYDMADALANASVQCYEDEYKHQYELDLFD